MSVETKLSLGLHEFFRYAIPGYVYLLVFFLPILLTDFVPFPIKPNTSSQLFYSTLLVIAGPVLGYFIFYFYYPVCKRFSYNFEKTPPFQVIKEYAARKLKEMGLSTHLDELKRDQKEMLVRALEDLAVHSVHESKPSPLRERLDFLFSSFHSLGATITAIWLGTLSWMIGGLSNRIITEQSLEIPPKTFWPLYFYAVLWICISLVLLVSWSHRKNLAIMEEYFLASIGKANINEFINAYAEDVKLFETKTQEDTKVKKLHSNQKTRIRTSKKTNE